MQVCESVVNVNYAEISMEWFNRKCVVFELKIEALPRLSGLFYDHQN